MIPKKIINIYNESEILGLSYKEILVLKKILFKTTAFKVQKYIILFVTIFCVYIVFKKVLKLTLYIKKE